MIATPNTLAGVSLAHEGLLHPLMADAPGGRTLPVIDVTHPAFALDESEDAMAQLRRRADQLLRQQQTAPKFIIDAFMWFAARRSILFRTFTNPSGAYLDCLTTYVLKLGPDNLVPPYSSWFDRYVVDLPPVISIRLRLQQTARLLAEGLAPLITTSGDAPLHLLNIGGGPAFDSLNALILLRRDHPQALENREISIHILDPDPKGPDFAKSSLAALQDSGPLNELNINISHVAYDWRDTSLLTDLLLSLRPGDPIIAASSEGALFEYGSDADVIANLSALRTAVSSFRFIVGSFTRNDTFSQSNLSFANYRLYPRGADGAGELAAEAGFVVDRVAEALLSDQVRLSPGN
ncbi:MAG: hypothetical protein KDJ19_12650 [Hyphomicrobiaceae bacterium]|nr:hypothetical protein [Hyphomicrobiaceae bacterium]MCC0024792.1 hypothetical protein [Hyphomicrobiaceae bacterium]